MLMRFKKVQVPVTLTRYTPDRLIGRKKNEMSRAHKIKDLKMRTDYSEMTRRSKIDGTENWKAIQSQISTLDQANVGEYEARKYR